MQPVVYEELTDDSMWDIYGLYVAMAGEALRHNKFKREPRIELAAVYGPEETYGRYRDSEREPI